MYNRKIGTLSCTIVLILISGCKYNIYENSYICNKNVPIIQLYSYNPYEDIILTIKNQLHLNHILYSDCKKYINCKKDLQYGKFVYLSLYIINISEQCIRTALFQDGQTAEYQLTLTVKIEIKTKKNKCHEFDIIVSRSFFNDPTMVLANSVKKNYIYQLIYQEISEKIINIVLQYIYNS